MEVRLQKYLADAGVASRRKAEELIAQGKEKNNHAWSIPEEYSIYGQREKYQRKYSAHGVHAPY